MREWGRRYRRAWRDRRVRRDSVAGAIVSVVAFGLSLLLAVIFKKSNPEHGDLLLMVLAWWSPLLSIFCIASPSLLDSLSKKGTPRVLRDPREIAEEAIDIVGEVAETARTESSVDEVFLMAPLLLPGMLEVHWSEPQNELLASGLERLRQLALWRPLVAVHLDKRGVRQFLSTAAAEGAFQNVAGDLRQQQYLGCPRHTVHETAPANWPLVDLLVSDKVALLLVRSWPVDDHRASDLCAFVFRNVSVLKMARRMIASTLRQIPGIVDKDQEAAYKEIMSDFDAADLRDDTILGRAGFFEAAAALYANLQPGDECYIMNETARPEPRVLKAFAHTSSRIRILWAYPERLETEQDLDSLVGMVVRLGISEDIKVQDGRGELELVGIPRSECRVKFIATARRVVAGHPVASKSVVGAVFLRTELCLKFVEHWKARYQRAAGRPPVTDICVELLREYMGRQPAGTRIENTPLWRRVETLDYLVSEDAEGDFPSIVNPARVREWLRARAKADSGHRPAAVTIAPPALGAPPSE